MRLVVCPWSQPEFWSKIEDEVSWVSLVATCVLV